MGVKYSVNEKFFDTWTPVMAYVLGFIYADGCIYISARGKYTVILSTDGFIIYRIKKWMQAEHPVIVSELPSPRKTRFVLRIGNRYLYDSLARHGVHPSKSFTMRMPYVPSPYLKDFVRGYFDGDGCVYLYIFKSLTQPDITKKLSVIFTGGSYEFLVDLLEVLREHLVLKQMNVYKHASSNAFQLRFSTGDAIQLFKFMYEEVNLEAFFPRKYDVFNDYFRRRPNKVDETVGAILQCLGTGHVVK